MSVAAAACGGPTGSVDEPWRAGHPDPAGMTFDQQASGLCAFQVRYPGEAPAAVDYQGRMYVQRTKTAAPATAPGNVIGRSGAWTVSAAGGYLYVLTGAAMYQYRSEDKC